MPTDPSKIPDATADPAAYKAALLDLIGDTDPIETLAATVPRWRTIATALTATQLGAEPAPHEWSVAAITGHLFDVDLVYGFRWRLMLTEDNPTYPGYNEGPLRAYAGRLSDTVLDAWQGLREANLVVLRDAWPAAAGRIAVHSEQGPETFDETVRKVAAHDIAHLDQLRRTVEAATR